MKKFIKCIINSAFLGFFMLILLPKVILAAEGAKVSFTFDDGFLSTYTNALPILKSQGMVGTLYVTTGFVGKAGYLSWGQIQELQNSHNWEIGSHTKTHPELPNVTSAKKTNEIQGSLTILQSYGLNVTTFATPFGAYDNLTLSTILKNYGIHRGFWDRDDLNSWPYNNAVIQVQSLEATTTLDQAKAWVDRAKNENKWLVFVLHEVKPSLDQAYEYTITNQMLTDIASYVKAANVPVVKINEALKAPGDGINIIQNGSFESGMTGFTADNITKIVLNTSRQGIYPNPQNSVRFTGATTAIHLYSQKTNIQNADYLFRAYVNADAMTAGEIGFYIDEYSSDGVWQAGKWVGATYANQLRTFSSLYRISSPLTRQIVLQVYMIAGSSGRAFIDGLEMYKVSDAVPFPSATPTPTIVPTLSPTPLPTVEPSLSPTPSITPTPSMSPVPSVTPSPSPTPTPTPSADLVLNGSFEELTSGFATHWTHNGSNVTIDTLSNGNDGANSLSFTVNANWSHAFSESMSVAPGATYTWAQFVKTSGGIGEFGFYIDEYDVNGNWISGQWKGQVAGNFSGGVQLSYVPTSSSVSKASLQYYMSPGTTFGVFVDSVKLLK